MGRTVCLPAKDLRPAAVFGAQKSPCRGAGSPQGVAQGAKERHASPNGSLGIDRLRAGADFGRFQAVSRQGGPGSLPWPVANRIGVQAAQEPARGGPRAQELSLIHISEPTRRTPISYAVFCL